MLDDDSGASQPLRQGTQPGETIGMDFGMNYQLWNQYIGWPRMDRMRTLDAPLVIVVLKKKLAAHF